MTTDEHGLNATDRLDVGTTPSASQARWRLVAPGGTRLTRVLSWHAVGERITNNWYPFVHAMLGQQVTVLDTCDRGAQASCESGSLGYGNGEQPLIRDVNADALEVGVRCDAPVQCANGVELHAVWAALYAAIVTIEDTTAPGISAPTGPLWSDAWQRGTTALTVTGTDNAIGIKEARLAVDGQQRTTISNGACDYTYVDPCKRPNAAFESSPALDTTQVGDGSHELKVSVVDAANNEASETRTVRVDNNAPAVPQVALSGPTWRNANDFDVSWSNGDGQASPIVRARYQLCGPAGCSAGERQGDVSGLSDLTVPGDGVWDLRVARDDEAGNQGAFPVAPNVLLRLDRAAPAAPQGLAPVTKRQSANGFGVRWTNPGGQLAPIVAAHHRVCPVGGGAACGPWTRVGGGNVQAIDGIKVPGAGAWRIEVRLEDEAGNADQAAVAGTDVELAGGPTPTPTPTPKADPRLTVSAKPSSDRRRVRVSGRIDSRAAGRVQVLVRVGAKRFTRNLRQRRGRYAVTVRLPRATRATKVRVSASYGGDARLKASAKRTSARLRRR